MIAFILITSCFFWIVLQTRDSRAEVWKRRFVPFKPFVRVFVGDVRATWQYFRSFKLRQVVSPSWWRERLQFRKLWSDFDTF